MKSVTRILAVSVACGLLSFLGPTVIASPTPSTVWAGWVATGQTFKVVRGSWTEPSLTCSSTFTVVLFEVGLDDYTNSSIEQAGSFAECNSGSPIYALWYRTGAGGGAGVDIINAGDKLTASVRYKAGTFTYSVTDATQPSESFTRTSGCGAVTCLRSSAEWVIESGTITNPVPPLAEFTAVHFHGASATDAAGTKGPINDASWTATQLKMVDGSSNTMAASSALNATGNGFKVTWKMGT